MLHQHTAGKGTCSLLVEDVLVEFAGRAMWHLVNNERVVIDMLLLVGDDAAIALALGALAREGEVELVARRTIVQRDDVVVDAAVALLVDIDIADANVLVVRLLQAIEVQRGILPDKGLNDLCSQEVPVVGSMVAEQHLQFGSFLQDDEHAAVDHQVDVGTQDVDDLDGAVDLDILGHIDKESVLCQRRVEVGDGIMVGTCQFVIEVRGER